MFNVFIMPHIQNPMLSHALAPHRATPFGALGRECDVGA
jgi:hypothetical protein